jgi:hypothetical protein
MTLRRASLQVPLFVALVDLHSVTQPKLHANASLTLQSPSPSAPAHAAPGYRRADLPLYSMLGQPIGKVRVDPCRSGQCSSPFCSAPHLPDQRNKPTPVFSAATRRLVRGRLMMLCSRLRYRNALRPNGWCEEEAVP